MNEKPWRVADLHPARDGRRIVSFPRAMAFPVYVTLNQIKLLLIIAIPGLISSRNLG